MSSFFFDFQVVKKSFEEASSTTVTKHIKSIKYHADENLFSFITFVSKEPVTDDEPAIHIHKSNRQTYSMTNLALTWLLCRHREQLEWQKYFLLINHKPSFYASHERWRKGCQQKFSQHDSSLVINLTFFFFRQQILVTIKMRKDSFLDDCCIISWLFVSKMKTLPSRLCWKLFSQFAVNSYFVIILILLSLEVSGQLQVVEIKL